MSTARVRSSLQGCAVAVLGTAAIVLVWLALPGEWGGRVPFSLFLLTVVGAAIVGGFWPGMLAMALGAMASCYFGEPRFEWALRHQADWAQLAVFLTTGPLTAFVCDRLRRALAASRAAEAALARSKREEASTLERQVAERTAELAALLLERTRLVDSERTARGEAERAARIRDEFLANVSHELRTPLNAIVGWSALMRKGVLDADTTVKAIEVIARNAEAQTALVEDLLDISRIGAGKLGCEMRPVSLSALVDGVVDAQRPVATTKGVELARAQDDGVCVVRGDPVRLEQITSNLLSNAIKFTPGGGRVVVGCRRAGSHAELIVRDTGAGIAADFLPYVFDRFRQADASVTRRYRGLGLGLSLVKFLVEQHGGVVRAESEGEGRGATFTVTIPIAAVSTDSRGPSPIEAGAPLAGVKALIVDDDEDARAVIRRILEDGHAEVSVATSGAEALDLLPRVRPDVLVSDVGMPDLDGYQLIRAVRALGREQGGATAAVALTAFAQPEDRDHALAVGYQIHLAKPVDRRELLQAVASLTRGAAAALPDPGAAPRR